MMNSLKKYGVWPVMPTPFTASGQLDRRGCKALIDWYLANRPWWEEILSGAYRTGYERLCGGSPMP